MAGKSKYRPTWPDRARKLAAKGILEKHIAEQLGVHPTTFSEIKRKNPELAKAIDDGYQEIVPAVEEALIKTCLGYEAEEVTKEISYNPKTGKASMRITKKVTKHIPPNQRAIDMFLSNKAPNKWKKRKQVEHSGRVEKIHRKGPPTLRFLEMEENKDLTLEEFLEGEDKQNKKGLDDA